MTKSQRQEVFNKYNGLCAYTGKPLGEDWQVDHVKPKHQWHWTLPENKGKVNNLDNLMPTLRILNHYKRGLQFESWRDYIKTLHTRLAKLPKKTTCPRTVKRIEYLKQVSEAFGITIDKPFTGVFYFETLIQQPCQP